jgi:hypothetical protein
VDAYKNLVLLLTSLLRDVSALEATTARRIQSKMTR